MAKLDSGDSVNCPSCSFDRDDERPNAMRERDGLSSKETEEVMCAGL